MRPGLIIAVGLAALVFLSLWALLFAFSSPSRQPVAQRRDPAPVALPVGP